MPAGREVPPLPLRGLCPRLRPHSPREEGRADARILREGAHPCPGGNHRDISQDIGLQKKGEGESPGLTKGDRSALFTYPFLRFRIRVRAAIAEAKKASHAPVGAGVGGGEVVTVRERVVASGVGVPTVVTGRVVGGGIVCRTVVAVVCVVTRVA